MTPPRSAAETIADWAAGLRPGDIPASAKAAACRHLLDGIGCAIGAVRTDAVPAAISAALREAEPERATIFADGRRVATTAAALANGALVHALDYDDTHEPALVHATAAVLPAAFAAGEETSATGADVLAAAIAGYEIVTRLGAAVPHGFHRRGLHATSVCGVFAAAAIAAKLMGLAAGATAAALGIAGSAAGGSLEFLNTGSSTKQLHPGIAAMNGIVAARLAAAGADGPATIFEGEYGIYRALAGEEVDPRVLTAGLGDRWETERITIKPYPACHLSHATLDALGYAEDVDPGAIERIVVTVPEPSMPIVCLPAMAKLHPRTPYEAKFSLPWSAAALVLDGTLTPDTYHNLDRPDVEALAAKIECVASAFDGPPGQAPGEATIMMRGGRIVRVTAARDDGRIGDDAFAAKLAGNCGPVDPSALTEAVTHLEDQPDLKAVFAATDLRGPR